MLTKKILKQLRIAPGERVRLAELDTGWLALPEMDGLDQDGIEKKAKQALAKSLEELGRSQEKLWANDGWSVLVVLQAMDTAGKDGTIKHVMSGVNPQGCQVVSFKRPSDEELDHNYLWRYSKALPERGRIGIFNRSYYEEVLVVKVRPEVLARQKLPPGKRDKRFWQRRYQDINRFERHLVRNGTLILKFFLHISKEEQRRRLLERLDNPKKHWKFDPADLAERALWDDYMEAYEDAISATSTRWAPWYVIPADHKATARALVASVLSTAIGKLDLDLPKPTADDLKRYVTARKQLEAEAVEGS